ncbi:hypothetical protein BDW69DRAFT_184184 [Aspergillus filifer]
MKLYTALLALAFGQLGSTINVGPNYQHPIEDLDKDLPFSQPVTFAHLEWQRCLASSHNTPIDIAILGFPYDTSTSYRPGARFGPRGIRAGSSREKKGRSYNTVWGVDPFEEDLSIVDCGDVPITPFDAAHAFKQMEQGYRQVLYHGTTKNGSEAEAGWTHPRIVSLGGDHSIVLPILRSLKSVYGPVSVIHLDSHLDTWDPYEGYTGIASEQSAITHGTFFWHAAREGCIKKGASVHGGLRTKLFGPKDYEIDLEVVGFHRIEAHEIDEIGVEGIVKRTVDVVGGNPVYLSIDIDVLDPKLKRYIKGLEGLNLVGADVVEVSPPYDSTAETTSVAAADLIIDILAAMAKNKKGVSVPVRATGKDEL